MVSDSLNDNSGIISLSFIILLALHGEYQTNARKNIKTYFPVELLTTKSVLPFIDLVESPPTSGGGG